MHGSPVGRLVAEIEDHDAAVLLVKDYLTTYDDGSPKFTGAWFEQLGGGGDRDDVANRFTGDDLVAVSMLSVSVPAREAVWILETAADQVGAFLRQIPTGVSPADPEGRAQLLNGDSAAHGLWRALRGRRGIEWVTTSKLLARKRPQLLPVYDGILESAIRPGTGNWWRVVAEFFESEPNIQRLHAVRGAAGAEGRLSLLRTLDVVVWMRHRHAR